MVKDKAAAFNMALTLGKHFVIWGLATETLDVGPQGVDLNVYREVRWGELG